MSSNNNPNNPSTLLSSLDFFDFKSVSVNHDKLDDARIYSIANDLRGLARLVQKHNQNLVDIDKLITDIRILVNDKINNDKDFYGDTDMDLIFAVEKIIKNILEHKVKS